MLAEPPYRYAGIEHGEAVLAAMFGAVILALAALPSSADVVSLAQAAGAQFGGALNAVSQGEQDLMRRAVAIILGRPV